MNNEFVPLSYPYGSITDGTYKCSRCGMDLTGCALCAGQRIHLIKNTEKKCSLYLD